MTTEDTTERRGRREVEQPKVGPDGARLAGASESKDTEAATPETDAAVRMAFAQEYMVPTEFAKQLERERDEAREALADWQNAADHVAADHADEVHCGCVPILRKLLTDAKRERDEAREAIIGWENKWKCAVEMAARAELERDEAREALREWQTLRLWGAQPQHIHDFIKGQQNRIHESQDIEKTCEQLERERDEAREHLAHIKEYGTDEINAAVELRQQLASALIDRDEARERAERYRLEANAMMMQRDDAREYVDRYRERLDLTPMSWEAAE